MKNIILIGMCSAGKTTLAKKIASKINYNYVDADEVIEKNRGETFQEFIDKLGEQEAILIEEKGLIQLSNLKKSVIATGGSAVYSKKAMIALKKNGIIVYLSLPFEIINKRLVDTDTRGIIGLKKKTLKELFEERIPLYKKYADIAINLNGEEDISKSVQEVINQLHLNNLEVDQKNNGAPHPKGCGL